MKDKKKDPEYHALSDDEYLYCLVNKIVYKFY